VQQEYLDKDARVGFQFAGLILEPAVVEVEAVQANAVGMVYIRGQVVMVVMVGL
jgi:hypothetical protein